MPRPKKKSKKKKDEDLVENYSLDTALSSTKKSESSLQNLLEAITEDEEVSEREQEPLKEEINQELLEDEKIQESVDSNKVKTKGNNKIVEQYLMEDVPITEQKKDYDKIKKTLKVKKETQEKEEEVESSTLTESATPPSVQAEKEEEIAKLSSEILEKKKDVVIQEEDIYTKLMAFFTELISENARKYELWETQISSLLVILRKMRKYTEMNTIELVNFINQSYERLKTGLGYFKTKRDEVEKIADVDIERMSEEFRKVLGMLELQVKEYQLKKQADEFIHEF